MNKYWRAISCLAVIYAGLLVWSFWIGPQMARVHRVVDGGTVDDLRNLHLDWIQSDSVPVRKQIEQRFCNIYWAYEGRGTENEMVLYANEMGCEIK